MLKEGRKDQKGIHSPARVWSQALEYQDPVSVYIHVPFCDQRCPFCLYYSIGGAGENSRSRFLASLEKELLLAGSLIDFAELNIEAVSIGGGTPSELSGSHLSTLLEMLDRHLSVGGARATEYSIELNPHVTTRPRLFREKLEVLQTHNVNRLSFGVQSLDDRVLKANGTRHTTYESEECVRIAREQGFRNVNVDLLFGLVGQSQQSWQATLQRACELQPEHISVFTLKRVLAGSRLRHDASGRGEDQAYRIALARRYCGENGYIEYFPLLFARSPEFAYKYEVNTFAGKKDVLGFGPGSITWAGSFCYRNVRDLVKYEDLLNRGMFPIDTDTIHYPSDNFLVRLAYFVASPKM